jgi:hypothetical protein
MSFKYRSAGMAKNLSFFDWLRALAIRINCSVLRWIFGHIRGTERGAQQGYVTLSVTKKKAGKTSKTG